MSSLLLREIEIEAIRRLCVVPEPMTVTEWAERYRMLPETSTSPGPYRVDVCPYHRRWQDLMADPEVSMIALCWASQTGKSTVIENGLGYRIHRTPSPIIVLRPKIEDAESWAKERFVPMIVATPVLRERVRLGKSSDSTLRYKGFPGGFLFVASATSATECASRSAPMVACDEVDRMDPIPGEGNPVEIVAKRQASSDVGLLIVTSTPRDAETTLIWPYLESGTNERYHVPCLHCGEYQELLWGGENTSFGLKWPTGKPEQAVYCCASCACAIEPREKRAMLEEGKWVATSPENHYPSSHLNGLYSPFDKSSWPVLAREFLSAQGKPADFQVFVNTRWAECWSEPSQQIDAATLAGGRLEAHEEGVVPAGAGVVTVGIDTQDSRLEAYWWAWGPGLESWLVKSAVFPGDVGADPEREDTPWSALAEALQTPLVHANGQPVHYSFALMDSAGHYTTNVYRFTHKRKMARLFSCVGRGGKLPILGKPTMQTKARVALFTVGVDTAKDEFLRSQILETKKGPGYVHLPEWMTTEQCEQLVSEKRVRKIVKGRPVFEWKPKRESGGNEALDCRVYARAALEMLGAKRLTPKHLEAMASRLDVPLVPAEPAPSPAEKPSAFNELRARNRPPMGRKSWVKGW